MNLKNDFMQFKQLDESKTELYIYGDIRKVGLFERLWAEDLDGDLEATSALTFKEALKEVKTDTLLVRINSGGGSVAEALAIYNQLQDFKGKVVTKVDGFAASAASVIFMAGEERIVPNSSLLMIHNAWTYAEGNASELRKMADDLDKITQPSINIYVEKTGQSEDVIKKMMDDETWITAQEAEELGFATKTVAEDAEMSFQQNAMLSLVKENKELKEALQKQPIVRELKIDSEPIMEKLNQLQNMLDNKINNENKNKETKSSSWDGFFNAEKE